MWVGDADAGAHHLEHHLLRRHVDNRWNESFVEARLVIGTDVDVIRNLWPMAIATREDHAIEGLVLGFVVNFLVFVGERIDPADVGEGLDKIDLCARVDHLVLVQELL